MQRWHNQKGHLVVQVDVPKTGKEVPFDLQMDNSGVADLQRNGGEGRAHARVAKLTDGEEGAIF